MSERHVQAHLVHPSHKLPVPGTQRFFSADDAGETIDTFDSFWLMLLHDGSLALGPRLSDAPTDHDELSA
ncbi:hypothetical protein MPC4_80157 [Methylocella tundrae]|uniref:Uncharacterized protein n=1 Tax=Methylocella tundrae TaxID=227605 RepID=A0A8B6MDD7_METTU|nr:hypothetical protein [Methylocella tundrae]VTZ27904.1 hypothetical protein MPC1_70014 [Methylocella tundrae]VTZ52486.1 hypothetical protein MPC4_80157 [Methylocella tundrae]